MSSVLAYILKVKRIFKKKHVFLVMQCNKWCLVMSRGNKLRGCGVAH